MCRTDADCCRRFLCFIDEGPKRAANHPRLRRGLLRTLEDGGKSLLLTRGRPVRRRGARLGDIPQRGDRHRPKQKAVAIVDVKITLAPKYPGELQRRRAWIIDTPRPDPVSSTTGRFLSDFLRGDRDQSAVKDQTPMRDTRAGLKQSHFQILEMVSDIVHHHDVKRSISNGSLSARP